MKLNSMLNGRHKSKEGCRVTRSYPRHKGNLHWTALEEEFMKFVLQVN